MKNGTDAFLFFQFFAFDFVDDGDGLLPDFVGGGCDGRAQYGGEVVDGEQGVQVMEEGGE